MNKMFTDIMNEVRLNGNEVFYSDEQYCATDGEYAVIGIHHSNPGCYKYLEMVLVYDIKTDDYKAIRVWDAIGDGSHYGDESKLLSVRYVDGNFEIKSAIKTAYVIPENVMAEDVKPGATIIPDLDLTKMESCFNYEVMDDMAILMTLKEEVPMTQFLKWHGFNMSYDAFKFWGSITSYGQSYLMFINTKTGDTWTVSYGNSTTCTSGDVWQRKDTLIECIKKMIPNHPKIREYTYTRW